MKCHGYDLLLQVDEQILNRGLSALFYTGKLKISGNYAFVKGIPEELQGFTDVKYRIRLRNEPFVDFMGPDKIGLRLSLEVVLIVFSGIEVEVDVDLGASAEIRVDQGGCKVVYDLSKTAIYDLLISDRMQFHRNVLDRMNEIMGIVLTHYLTEDIKEISLPLSLFQIQIPTLPDALSRFIPTNRVDVDIMNNRLLTVGIDFFDHQGGSLEGLQDMTEGATIFTALRAEAMSRIAAYWWEHTSMEKRREFKGTMPVNARRALAKGTDFFSRCITLGFFEPHTEVKRADLIYDVNVEVIDLPEFLFEDNNIAKVKNLKLKVSVKAHMETECHKALKLDTSGLVPDKWTPWQDDVTMFEKDENKAILHIKEDIDVLVGTAACTVGVDGQNRMVLKVTEADLELDFGNQWYENFSDQIMNGFLDILERNLVGRIPPIVISPALLVNDINLLGYSFDLDINNLMLAPEEASFAGDVRVRELEPKAVPVPLYIGNSKSLKLHRFDCAVVEDIDFAHRVGYHGVGDAVKDGYKPCGECLRGYQENMA